MSEDRELLELAARAYWGPEIDDVVSIEWSEEDGCILYTHANNQDHNGCDRAFRWHPLDENHQAFELAVKLRLTVLIEPYSVRIGPSYSYPDLLVDGDASEEDRCAITRRAIVMTAALIGSCLTP